VLRDAIWTRVRGKFAEIDQRKVAEVVRRTRDKKNNASATHSAISLETEIGDRIAIRQ